MNYTKNKHKYCWRVLANSVRGASHEKTGQPCQDAHNWKILPDGVLVAAVADGAGSAPLGEIGAEAAARASVESIAQRKTELPDNDNGWESLLTEALQAAQEAIEMELVAHEVTERDLATTLILAVATPDLIAAVQVGDGALVIGDSDGNIVGLTVPQNDEYINQTTFLISSGALSKAQFAIRRGAVTNVAIISDGLQMLALKMPECVPHAPFFAPLFRFISVMTDETAADEQLKDFLLSPRVRERTNDDLTLLLANVEVV
jgi:hypothetical protein